MKKTVLLIVFILLLTSVVPAYAAKKQAEPVVTSEPIPEPTANPDAAPYDPEHPEELTPDQLWAASAVLMTQDKGEVIFEKDPDSIRYPASMTKILTVLLGIMFVDDLQETITVSETAVNVPEDSSTMHLKVGEEIRFIDVLYGTMLVSANDGANVIAEVVSGDVDRFVTMMNHGVCGHAHTVVVLLHEAGATVHSGQIRRIDAELARDGGGDDLLTPVAEDIRNEDHSAVDMGCHGGAVVVADSP